MLGSTAAIQGDHDGLEKQPNRSSGNSKANTKS